MTVVALWDRSDGPDPDIVDYLFDLLARPAWHEQAACRGVGADGTKPNVFFPDRGENHRPAAQLCQTCPVFEECRAHAQGLPERFGIWHGLGQRARTRGRRTGRPTGPVAA